MEILCVCVCVTPNDFNHSTNCEVQQNHSLRIISKTMCVCVCVCVCVCQGINSNHAQTARFNNPNSYYCCKQAIA